MLLKVKEMEQKLLAMQIEEPRIGASSEVSIADFGASTDKNVCNLEVFKRALAYCQENHVGRLTIPKGTYYFHNRPDNGSHLALDGLADFILDGNGAELIFENTSSFISVARCKRIRLQNLILDWNWERAPIASVGVVRYVDASGAYFDLDFPGRSEISDNMPIKIVGPFDPVRYTPGAPGGIEFRPFKNQFLSPSGHKETDEKMEEMVRELSNIIFGIEKIDLHSMRIYSAKPEWTAARIKVGQCYNFRHFEYDTTAVDLFDSQHITLQNITIYSCPGSGFVGNGDISHIRFTHCHIGLKPGTARSISTAVDCLHVANSKGYFIVENCDFGDAGDDCINIHDNTSMGAVRIDEHTLLALRVRHGSVLFEEGNTVELRNPDLSPTGFCSILTAVGYHDEDSTCTLTFQDTLPERLSENTVLFNNRFHTENFIIRNNKFTNNRARGILIQGSNGIVENNLFENIQGAAIQIEAGCETRWSEGKGVHNLIIRNNMIRHCDLNAWQMAVVYMGVYLPEGRTAYPIFKNILIEHNTIIDCPRLAMFLSSCKDILVRHNVIVNSNQISLDRNCYGSSQQESPIYGEKYQGTIQIIQASDVRFLDNFIFSTTSQMENGIYADQSSTNNIEKK